MRRNFLGLNPEGPNLEKEKENFCVVLSYFVKRVRELSRATTAKKRTKKRDTRSQLLFC